jgi:hypothetical protein
LLAGGDWCYYLSGGEIKRGADSINQAGGIAKVKSLLLKT